MKRILFLALAAVSLLLATQVKTNYDLAEYLPDDSRMKQGMRIMEQAFGPSAASDLRVMLTGLTEEEQAVIRLAQEAMNADRSIPCTA